MSLTLLMPTDIPALNKKKKVEENLKKFCAWEGRGRSHETLPYTRKQPEWRKWTR